MAIDDPDDDLRIPAEVAAEDKEPRIDILAHGLADEETAFRIEAAVIDLCGASAVGLQPSPSDRSPKASGNRTSDGMSRNTCREGCGVPLSM